MKSGKETQLTMTTRQAVEYIAAGTIVAGGTSLAVIAAIGSAMADRPLVGLLEGTGAVVGLAVLGVIGRRMHIAKAI